MNEFVGKLSSYNILNNLLPGVMFSVLGELLTSYTFIHQDLFVAVFIYYFIGLIISRIGSLIVQPLLQVLRVVKFVSYEEYVSAEKSDNKISLLSEQNNTYRTSIALITALATLMICDKYTDLVPGLRDNAVIVLGTMFLVGSILAYRKQTKYVVERIRNMNKTI